MTTGFDYQPDLFSRGVRPALHGIRGAVSAAHPLAVAAAQEMFAAGGTAADAVIAAQAVICVIAPESGGIGGDGFFLIRDSDGATAVNAAGCAPRKLTRLAVADDGTSVTVPGLVAGWETILRRWGCLHFSQVLAPAVRLAALGTIARPQLIVATQQQHTRLAKGGAGTWSVTNCASGVGPMRQENLANSLEKIGAHGAEWFYNGPLADAMSMAVKAHGGEMEVSDLQDHRTVVKAPISMKWRDSTVHMQPPMSQGVILGLALANFERLSDIDPELVDHASIELTEASFAYRDEVMRGEALLSEHLTIDLQKARLRGGPRAYLHTAGVAASDSSGLTISSLLSVFDDFGSCIFVPEGGFTLNNRGAGFTAGSNAIAPGAMPVHTLAPILIEGEKFRLGLATPGADGQVQTLLQILVSAESSKLPLDAAIHQPRWRSEGGKLLIENDHPAAERLKQLGHDLVLLQRGDMRFGSVVCAGFSSQRPWTISDWRRETWSGVS